MVLVGIDWQDGSRLPPAAALHTSGPDRRVRSRTTLELCALASLVVLTRLAEGTHAIEAAALLPWFSPHAEREHNKQSGPTTRMHICRRSRASAEAIVQLPASRRFWPHESVSLCMLLLPEGGGLLIRRLILKCER